MGWSLRVPLVPINEIGELPADLLGAWRNVAFDAANINTVPATGHLEIAYPGDMLGVLFQERLDLVIRSLFTELF